MPAFAKQIAMPPPMVPAPTTPADLTGVARDLFANPRHAAAVALREEYVHRTARLDALLALVDERSLELQSFREAGLRCLAHRLHGDEAGVAIGIELSGLFGQPLENLVRRSGRIHAHFAGATRSLAGGEQRSRVANGAGPQIAFDDVVEEAQFLAPAAR